MGFTLSIQGWFYLITGLWPVFHMKSFENISGRKTDHWLVKMVGLLLAASGMCFLLYSQDEGMKVLGILEAGALIGIDVFYVVRARIARVYLLDAVAEAFLILGHALSA
jgi:hypothetical protein